MRFLRALLVAASLLVAPLAHGGVTFVACTADTGATPNTSASFTPALDDYLIVGIVAPGTTQATATLTSSLGGGFTFAQEVAQTYAAGANSIYLFYADALVSSATAQTVVFDTASDAATGTVICIWRITDATSAGASGTVQNDGNSGGAATTPSTVFGSSADTDNVTLAIVGNNANPAGLTEPSGWTEDADTGHATPDTGGEAISRASGFASTTITWGAASASAWGAIAVEIAVDAATPAGLDSGPTFSVVDANTYRATFDADANASNAFLAVLFNGTAACTCDAIEANTCTGEINYATAATTGASQTLDVDVTLPTSDPLPLNDLDFCVEGAGGDSSVTSGNAQGPLTAPSGYQYVQRTGSPGVGEEDMFDGASPAIATDDTMQAVTHCDSFDEGAAANALTLNNDGTFEIDTSGTPADDSRQECDRRFADYSVPEWSDATPQPYYVSDQPQVYVGLPELEGGGDPFLWPVDEANNVTLNTLWSDPEGDTLTHNVTGLPTGLSEDGTSISGTPTLCGNDTDIVFETTSITGVVVTESDQDIHIGARVPDVTGDDASTADTAIEALCSLVGTQGTSVFDNLIAAGLVVSTDPVAETIVTSTAEVTFSLSLGPQVASERKIVYVLPSDAGLVRWVDYIPVSDVPGCEVGTYEANGCWAVDVIASDTGLTAWSDYIPVFEVSQTANKWRFENDGWIPVDTLTP
jgi:hypothetical protein